jgi:hypothetical protein
MTPTTLTPQQQADAKHVEELAGPDGRLRLDFSDEGQYRFAVDMHSLAGHTADLRPGLHKGLELAREAHIAAGGPPPPENPDDAGFSTQGWIANWFIPEEAPGGIRATASASILDGASTLSNALLVKDPQGNVLASGGDSGYGRVAFLQVEADSTAAPPPDGEPKANFVFTFQQRDQPPVTDYVGANLEESDLSAPPKIEIEQPVQSKGSGPLIRIGLGRGEDASDIDYWFWKNTNTLNYAVPFVGNAQFPGQIEEIRAVEGKLIRGPGARLDLDLPQGGAADIPPDQIANILKNCAKGGSKLTWTLPHEDTDAQSNPILFGELGTTLKWTSNERTDFWIQFEVKLVKQQKPVVFNVESSDTGKGNGKILPLQFLYHCLAEGTQMTLADGSTMAVEDLHSGVVLRGPDGQERPVISTVLGSHEGEVTRLVAAGRELLLSPNHLVLTPGGPRLAIELTPGETVCVEGGTATLEAREEVEFKGLLCNASLAGPGEPVGPESNTMLANGILVGDYELQLQAQREELEEDPERVLAELDEMYHQDYENHRAEKAGRA